MNIETLLVTDLDGTLWDGEEECHQDSLSAIDKVRDSGTHLLIATGRRLRSVRQPFLKYGITEETVLLNGSIGYDFTNESNFYKRQFANDNEARIKEIFTTCGLSPCFYADDSFVYASSPSTSQGHIDAIGEDLILMNQPNDFPLDRHILSFCLLGVEKSRLEEAEHLISSESLGSVAYYRDRLFGEYSLMVQPPNTSKWIGVELWCEHYGVSPARIVAVGDAGNDFELLTGADFSVAIEDSEQFLLDVADATIPPPSKGGWAQILDYL